MHHEVLVMRPLLPRRRPSRPKTNLPMEVRAILDFGASGARAAIVGVTPQAVEILGVGGAMGQSGIARPGQAMRRDELALLVESALSRAEQATVQYVADLPVAADEALVGLTGSYLKAESNVIYLPRANTAAPIYESEIHAALKEAQQQNLARLAEQARHAKIRRTLVASQLVAAMSVREEHGEAHRLPDVKRGVPGLAGDTLAVAICNVTFPRKGLEVMVQVLQDVDLTMTEAVPQAQAIAAALPMPDAILIDIGHEHTEIALAEAGNLSAFVAITTGGEFFTQRLALGLAIPQIEAEQRKQSYVRSNGREGAEAIAPIMEEAIGSWLRSLEQALLYLAGEVALPPRIYLFGGGSMLPGLFERLRNHAWTRRLPFDQTPPVERLLPYHLRGIHDGRGQLTHPSQVGLAALAVWSGRTVGDLQGTLETLTTQLAKPLGLR